MPTSPVTAAARVWRCRVAPPPRGLPHPFDSIVRAILGEAVGVRPDLLRFEYGGRGKPRLDPSHGGPDVRFNLSHSSEWLVVGVAVGRGVGVDVQRIDVAGRSLEGITRFLTPAERSLLDGHSITDRLHTLA